MEYFYFKSDPASNRATFAVTHPGQLCSQESCGWLDRCQLDICAKDDIEQQFGQIIKQRGLRAINQAHPRWRELEIIPERRPPFTVNLLACGDVGSTLLIGLKLLSNDTISQIGIYDIDDSLCRRCEFELNQIASPDEYAVFPQIKPVNKEQLFDGDMFIFCATAGVPNLQNKGDVRLAQYQRNAQIIREYALLAREKHFRGLFAVVSDPVDLLCQAAFLASNQDGYGKWDGLGLFPEQIEGYGLGVMHARARYYAAQDEQLASYLTDGRAYGPHGQGLIIANSITYYDEVVSLKLTELALRANIQAREYGFKPYVAPALSSGALSILATLKGQWHYSSTYLGGVFIGARNRRIPAGIELEVLPMPRQLMDRINNTANSLRTLQQKLSDQC